ncbi:hypothetical protein [Kibdelosporangium philippinense]
MSCPLPERATHGARPEARNAEPGTSPDKGLDGRTVHLAAG